MNAISGPGTVHIGVETDAEGNVSSVSLLSNRPAGLGRLFAGRSPRDVPALARQLFSLCGFAHGAAARLTLAAACGEAPPPDELFRLFIGSRAEYAAELLRSTALGWPAQSGGLDLSQAAAPVRDAIAAARIMMAPIQQGQSSAPLLGSATDALARAWEALGLRNGSEPAGGSFLHAMVEEARADPFLMPREPDALLPADDEAVAQALRKGGAAFAAAPALPHRIAETGPAARFWSEARGEPTLLSARLRARLSAAGRALQELRDILSPDAPPFDEVARVRRLGDGEAIAALETARGRLYHWARLDKTGAIADYAIVAPTEWNFHPAGPFATTLFGAQIGRGEAARLRISRLAALFDPCVAFDVDLRERADA